MFATENMYYFEFANKPKKGSSLYCDHVLWCKDIRKGMRSNRTTSRTRHAPLCVLMSFKGNYKFIYCAWRNRILVPEWDRRHHIYTYIYVHDMFMQSVRGWSQFFIWSKFVRSRMIMLTRGGARATVTLKGVVLTLKWVNTLSKLCTAFDYWLTRDIYIIWWQGALVHVNWVTITSCQLWRTYLDSLSKFVNPSKFTRRIKFPNRK